MPSLRASAREAISSFTGQGGGEEKALGEVDEEPSPELVADSLVQYCPRRRPLPPAGSDSSKAWWRIVWCHERCHKQENQARCQALRGSVNDTGALLVCLKKAVQFALWVKRTSRPPYVLVTDWREAQPCVQALGAATDVSLPFLIVVLCDSPRQYGKASEWAKGFPNVVGPVCVCERSNIPPALLGGIVRKHFGLSGEDGGCEEGGPSGPRGGCEAARKSASLAAGRPPFGSLDVLTSDQDQSDADVGQEACYESPEEDGRTGCSSFGEDPKAQQQEEAVAHETPPGLRRPEAHLDSVPAPVKLFRSVDGTLAICECSSAVAASRANPSAGGAWRLPSSPGGGPEEAALLRGSGSCEGFSSEPCRATFLRL